MFSCTTTIPATTKINLNYKMEVLPPCSPESSQCDFHIFGPLTESLRGHWFGSDEVIEAVHTWIWEHPKICFSDGFRKLVDGYKTCVELVGHYVER
jgi:hypothetical protein